MRNTAIIDVRGRRVWDSRGWPTVEVDVITEGGGRGRAMAPGGMSTGSREALELRDGGAAFGGKNVAGAVRGINDEVARALRGHDAMDQEGCDARLVSLDGTPNLSRLGANAIIATSMAVAHAAAHCASLPLWSHLRGGRAVQLPMPEVQIFGGGAHAAGASRIQEFMIIPVGAHSYVEALDWAAEVYRAAALLLDEQGLRRGTADQGGYWPLDAGDEPTLALIVRAIERAGLAPGRDIGISMDVAATQLAVAGGYRLSGDRRMDAAEVSDLLERWLRRYPIVAIEDPLGESDFDGMRAITAAIGDRVEIIGDDFLGTRASRVEEAARGGACNTALIKPSQAGTLTAARAAFDAARTAGWNAVVSGRSGDTEDTTVMHLAVGWGATQIKVGAFARSERMAKWNEGIRIAEASGGDGLLPARSQFPWSHG
ncbi:MAG: enolase C-terminal domain-like protein [Minicystis sp.]